MDRAKHMGEKSIPRLLASFSVPAIIGMVTHALYNVVDRIFIGRGVGPLGIAGAAVGFPIMMILMAFGMLVGLGANALISIRLGEKKKEEAELVLGNALVLLIGLALTLTTAGLIFLKPLLLLFGASGATLPYAADYLSIILMGSVFQAVGFGMNNFIRGEGNPRIAMLTMLIGALLNTILDPIFIFIFDMGIKGAALATVISMAASATWVLSYFLGGRSLLKIRLRNLMLRLAVVRSIFAVGSPPFVLQLASSATTAILNNQLQRYGGDLAISAFGIIFSIMFMFFMPVIGLNQGAQPIIGFNFGAKQYERVKKTLQYAIAAATVWVIIGFGATQFFPSHLVGLFNRDSARLMEIGTRGMRIFLMMMPIIGFQIVSANYFQAVGKPRQAMFLTLSRQVLLLIPLIFVLPLFFGLTGIWVAGPISDLTSSIITGLLILSEMRHLNRKSVQMGAVNPRFAEQESS